MLLLEALKHRPGFRVPAEGPRSRPGSGPWVQAGALPTLQRPRSRLCPLRSPLKVVLHCGRNTTVNLSLRPFSVHSLRWRPRARACVGLEALTSELSSALSPCSCSDRLAFPTSNMPSAVHCIPGSPPGRCRCSSRCPQAPLTRGLLRPPRGGRGPAAPPCFRCSDGAWPPPGFARPAAPWPPPEPPPGSGTLSLPVLRECVSCGCEKRGQCPVWDTAWPLNVQLSALARFQPSAPSAPCESLSFGVRGAVVCPACARSWPCGSEPGRRFLLGPTREGSGR